MSNSLGWKFNSLASGFGVRLAARWESCAFQRSAGRAVRVFARPVVCLSLVMLGLLRPHVLQGQVPETVPAQFDAETQRAIALEESVVVARRAIRSGEADVVHTDVSGSDIRHWKLWFQGDKLRMEQYASSQEQPAKIVKNDAKIYHKQVGIHEKTKQLMLGNAEVHPEDWNGTMLFDLRRLGITMIPSGGLHSTNDWNHTLGTKQRLRSTIADVELNGRPVKLITRLDPDGDAIKLWIDEERGPSLVRGELTSKHRGQVLADVFVVDLEQFDDVWFPQRVTHHRTVGGFGPPADETTLKNVRLNQGIDENLFTLGSVGVEVGETVNIYPSSPGKMSPIWDGTKLVERGSPLPTAKPAPVGSLRNWIVLANLAFAAACVTFYIWKRKVAR